MDSGSELIFGRYTRRECGLPPVRRGSGRGVLLLAWVALLAALAGIGAVAGRYAARLRAADAAQLPARIAADPSEAPRLLAISRLWAVSQPHNPDLRISAALGLAVQAEREPRRLGSWGTIASICRSLPADAEPGPSARLLFAGVFAELGEWGAAFAQLAGAEAQVEQLPDGPDRRSMQLLLLNTRAWLLATAPAGQGGNPEGALHIAQLAVTSRDKLPGGGYASGEAAFVDTLAAAWFAVGQQDKALQTQKLALGLAAGDLSAYIENFDRFRNK